MQLVATPRPLKSPMGEGARPPCAASRQRAATFSPPSGTMADRPMGTPRRRSGSGLLLLELRGDLPQAVGAHGNPVSCLVGGHRQATGMRPGSRSSRPANLCPTWKRLANGAGGTLEWERDSGSRCDLGDSRPTSARTAGRRKAPSAAQAGLALLHDLLRRRRRLHRRGLNPAQGRRGLCKAGTQRFRLR
jgi:hypothetical protein